VSQTALIQLVASKGEIIYCANGHDCFEFIRNVMEFEVTGDGQLKPLQSNMDLVYGEPVPVCAYCGSEVIWLIRAIKPFITVAGG